jgi:hypothetical protein
MTSHLLTELDGAIALPSCPFHLQQRGSEGLLWDPHRGDVVEVALSGLRSVPARRELECDVRELQAQAGRAQQQAPVIETAAIFGGYLLRHFGHFCHESLARLWWLGAGDQQHQISRDTCKALQDQGLDVYFFMPTWLDSGKDLLPYMREILAGLGLAEERIRIIAEPLVFSRLLVPAQIWGFDLEALAIDQRFGCDSRAMMRSLFAAFQRCSPADQLEPIGGGAPAGKVFVTRSGLSPTLGRPIGDGWLDEVLRDAGYFVFRPERFGIQSQIDVFASARELVFIDGSSMYLLWFTRLRSDVRITIILRRRQGAWMITKVRDLMPINLPIRWQVINEVIGEELTSANDWESHNLLDLGAIARQLLAPRLVRASALAEQALGRNLQELAAQLGPEPMARILEVLIRRCLVAEPQPPRRLISRLSQRLRRLLRFGFRRGRQA